MDPCVEFDLNYRAFNVLQILNLRITHDQQLRLLTAQEQRELRVEDAFSPFLGQNPLQYNPYTQPLWTAAVAQYERIMSPAEQKTVMKLRQQFRALEGNPQQVRILIVSINGDSDIMFFV